MTQDHENQTSRNSANPRDWLWIILILLIILSPLLYLLSKTGILAIQNKIEEPQREQAAQVANMEFYYTATLRQADPTMIGTIFKPIPKNFTKNNNPNTWMTDPIKPSGKKLLAKLITAYNQDNPTQKTNITQIQDYYGKNWKTNCTNNPNNTNNTNNPVQQFTLWCGQDADLVYKHDVTDADGTVHHKGEPVTDLTIRNFDFLRQTHSRAFRDYQLHSQYLAEQKAGQ